MTTPRRHVLALDDSPEVLAVLRELLEEEGYRVTTGSRPISDLAEFRRIAPDLILLDYMWGDEDAGWSTLQLLRLDRALAKIPVILCTGAKAQVAEIADQLKRLRVRVVLKPFDIDTLTGAIAEELGDGSRPS